MFKKLFLFFVVLAVFAPMISHGAEMRSGESYFLNPQETVNDNLYVAAGNVGVSGTVNGDVLAAGGTVNASGSVSGDVGAAGGQLNISGQVAGDVRAAGGNINVSSAIGGDLMIFGGNVDVSGGSVGKDANISGGNINFLGSAQTLSVRGGSVYVNGIISGDVVVTAGQVRLGPNASIAGNFDYYSPTEANIDQGAVVSGTTNFHRTEVSRRGQIDGSFWLVAMLWWIAKLITLLVAAWIMIYFFRKQTDAILDKSMARFWWQTLVGLIVLVVVPVACVIAMMTVVGFLVALVVMLFYITFLVLASIVSVLLFARLWLRYLFKREDYRLNWWIVLISAIVLTAIGLIPFVGWIFGFIIFLSALGSVSATIYGRLRD